MAGAILDTEVVADIRPSLTQPNVAALADGRFVIVYANEFTDEVLGRIYNPATMTFSGAEFQVARDLDNGEPAVAGLPDGGFLVAWTGDLPSDGGDAILARRFDSSGQAAGEIFRVNTSTHNEQDFAGIAVNASGKIFVAWSDEGRPNPYSTDTDGGVQGQFLTPTEVINGTPNPDLLTTYNLSEQINALAGNDTINAGGGNDTIAGDEGNDVIAGDRVRTAFCSGSSPKASTPIRSPTTRPPTTRSSSTTRSSRD